MYASTGVGTFLHLCFCGVLGANVHVQLCSIGTNLKEHYVPEGMVEGGGVAILWRIAGEIVSFETCSHVALPPAQGRDMAQSAMTVRGSREQESISCGIQTLGCLRSAC